MPKAVTEAQTRPGKVRESQFSSKEGKKQGEEAQGVPSLCTWTHMPLQAEIRHLNVFSFVTENTGRVIGKLQ